MQQISSMKSDLIHDSLMYSVTQKLISTITQRIVRLSLITMIRKMRFKFLDAGQMSRCNDKDNDHAYKMITLRDKG